MLTIQPREVLAEAIQIKPIDPDNMSDVRYIHSSSFRMQAREQLSRVEIQAFTDLVYTPEYVEKLGAENMHVAWLGKEIVGTGGWTPSPDNKTTARIRSIFVRPLFTGLGIGRRLVEDAENRAYLAGFREMTARATVNSVGFFEYLGYRVKSHGVRNTLNKNDLPVRFMRKSDVRPVAAICSSDAGSAQPADAGPTAR